MRCRMLWTLPLTGRRAAWIGGRSLPGQQGRALSWRLVRGARLRPRAAPT